MKNIDNKINELISKFKNLDIVEELKMTDSEIKNNISNLLLYENTNLACKQLDENQCSSVEKLHIDFFRNKNGDIEFVWNNCPKFEKQLSNNSKFYYGINNSLESYLLLFNPKNIDIKIEPSSRGPLIKSLIAQIKSEQYNGIYLYGNTGVGKSYIMSAFLNKLTNNKIYVNYIDICEFIIYIKSKPDSDELYEYIQKLKTYSILLIDNIGSEQFSQYYHVQYLIPILEYRYKNNLTTYFISQYDIEELKKYYLNNIINNGRNDAFKKDIFKLIDLIKSLYKLKFELKGNSQR